VEGTPLPARSPNLKTVFPQIFADGHSRQTEGHPQEGAGAGAGGPQFAHQIPPLVPKHEAASLPIGWIFVFSVSTIIRHQ
jgi:hypothetical protein